MQRVRHKYKVTILSQISLHYTLRVAAKNTIYYIIIVLLNKYVMRRVLNVRLHFILIAQGTRRNKLLYLERGNTSKMRYR